MASPEQFSVKWKDFNKNMATHLGILRDDEVFSDVTLVCEEDIDFFAHKVILSAGSLFFRNMLKKNNNSHTLIYMRRLKAKDLAAVVDFIYYGEAKIFQDDLNSFLAVAEELQLKGITKPPERSPSPTEPPERSPSPTEPPERSPSLTKPFEISPFPTEPDENSPSLTEPPELPTKENIKPKYEEPDLSAGIFTSLVDVNLKTNDFRQKSANLGNANIDDIKAQVDMMVNKIVHENRNKFQCSNCRKTASNKTDMDLHIKTHKKIDLENTTEEQLNGCFENVNLKEMVEQMSNAPSGHTREKIDAMMEKSVNGQYQYKCKSCGKEGKLKNDMAKHIELHLNISYPCIYCEHVLKTSYGFKHHLRSIHIAHERRLN